MYTALYRKWRPLTFDDVVSQPHITATLSRQVMEGKTAHAYLFTGSRGTGKTTCARILAKAINCLDPHDGKPCLECDICVAADAGALSDIVEIDAASNTGVDDIRELRDAAVYTPEICRYKVYIIDEVHMLSNAAFNALLKIMEEPPEHVKFILATTEVHKVPATIISRCQRFDFRRIREEDIVSRLEHIAECEKIDLTHDAAALIARLSDGAMRDALSLLDQCVAFSERIDREAVSNAAGIAGRDYLFEILEAAARGDTAAAITVVDELYSKSKDMTRLCDELLMQLRNVMLIKTVPQKPELISCFDDEIERLKAVSDNLTLGEILKKLEILQSCAEALPRAVSKRTEFEMAVVKLCSSARAAGYDSPADISALEKRLERLETELRELKASGVRPAESSGESPKKAAQPPRTNISEPSAQTSDFTQSPEPVQPSSSAQSAPEEELLRCSRWEEILDSLTAINPGCAGALQGSEAYTRGDKLMILVKNEFFLGLFKKPENAASLRKAAFEVTGISYKIMAKCSKEQKNLPENGIDPVEELIQKAKDADIPVDVDNTDFQ